MPSKEEYIVKIVNFVNENFPYDQSTELPLDKSLLETGILDSYAILIIVSFFEKAFDITIEDDEIVPENFGSILKMADFISRRSKDK